MRRLGVVLGLTVFLIACGKDSGESGLSEAASETFRENPEFGGVEGVQTEAEAVAPTLEEATLRALDAAIAQVNGRRVASSQVASQAGVQVDINGLRAIDAESRAFADLVVSSSRGAVRSFSIVSTERVSEVEYESSASASASVGGWLDRSTFAAEASETRYDRYWKVRVKAEVAKFVGPKDDGRPSLVVAAPRVSGSSYAVGDARVNAGDVAAEVRQRLSDALTKTERFQVLDREAGAEMQSEVDFIQGPNARTEDIAKLGQRFSADLILVPVIERFEYPRVTRQLRMSDRQLVSYAGGGRITLRLINFATGEVVMSESFEQQLPATPPSTMPRSIDGIAKANELMDGLSEKMIRAVVSEIFPISVVAMQGSTLVLSQGGDSVVQGQRYQVVQLGDELKDPQTGRSLGRLETPCCVAVVERVADQTSYARVEGELPNLDVEFKAGMLELREALGAAVSPSSPEGLSSVDSTETPRAERRSAVASPRPALETAPVSTPAADEVDEDW